VSCCSWRSARRALHGEERRRRVPPVGLQIRNLHALKIALPNVALAGGGGRCKALRMPGGSALLVRGGARLQCVRYGRRLVHPRVHRRDASQGEVHPARAALRGCLPLAVLAVGCRGRLRSIGTRLRSLTSPPATVGRRLFGGIVYLLVGGVWATPTERGRGAAGRRLHPSLQPSSMRPQTRCVCYVH